MVLMKRSDLGFFGKMESIREMMMIGRRKIKRYVMILILSCPVSRRGGPATHANRFHMRAGVHHQSSLNRPCMLARKAWKWGLAKEAAAAA
jgi:hypothetical protein